MKRGHLILALLAATGLMLAQADINVNSRYLVERVDIKGGSKNQISRGLREDLEKIVGQRLSQESLDGLAKRIRTELHARLVSPTVARGTQPEQVVVLFEVKGRSATGGFDLSLPKAIYHSRQGWSGILEARIPVGGSRFNFGIVSDGDALVERFAGLRAGYENRHVGTDRLRLGFQFSSFHQQWDHSTLAALATAPDVPGIYRTRQDFAPSITFVLAKPLTLAVGTSFDRFQKQFPAAHTEAANAVTGTLRYARRLVDAEGNKHELDAGYSLRAATRTLDSDYVYARHEVHAGYQYDRRRQEVSVKFIAGRTSGTPPLYERFVLGNSSTLRGWDKFDLAPLGATRVAYASLQYGYHGFQVFYDTGALWDEGQSGEIKHSLGVGYSDQDLFFSVAFPVKSGRAQPIFMAGVTF